MHNIGILLTYYYIITAVAIFCQSVLDDLREIKQIALYNPLKRIACVPLGCVGRSAPLCPFGITSQSLLAQRLLVY